MVLFFSKTTRPALKPTSPQIQWIMGLFLWVKAAEGIKLATLLHLRPRLQYVCVERNKSTFYLTNGLWGWMVEGPALRPCLRRSWSLGTCTVPELSCSFNIQQDYEPLQINSTIQIRQEMGAEVNTSPTVKFHSPEWYANHVKTRSKTQHTELCILPTRYLK